MAAIEMETEFFLKIRKEKRKRQECEKLVNSPS